MEERSISFTLFGAPRTKKNNPRPVSFTSKTGKRITKILPSKAYTKWFKRQMEWSIVLRGALVRRGVQLPIQGKVKIDAMFYADRWVGDLNGYQQALGDFLQAPKCKKGQPWVQTRTGAGIIDDDKDIRNWGDSTVIEGDPRPRVEVTITFDGELNKILTTKEAVGEERQRMAGRGTTGKPALRTEPAGGSTLPGVDRDSQESPRVVSPTSIGVNAASKKGLLDW